DLGFKNSPKHGDKIPEPLFEMTTKFEKTDRLLDIAEAKQIGGLRSEDVDSIRETIFKMDREIDSTALSKGLIHADGKKEFALDNDRQPVLVDTFGTADEDRFWEKEEYERNGTMVERSKEFVRQYYRKIGYYQKLTEARGKKMEEPPIPALPSDMLSETSSLYRNLFERITGQHW
ncbi:MAG: phosphoribosylaminoimidazolesuccinocarboxamide synthase, partial [Candidatus Thermoplasmatota archaeon]|nr:phosphoribosylaminoimidazolesuccinocarboxamide synthase [Candidatus Thermoplasmatota archaeon]